MKKFAAFLFLMWMFGIGPCEMKGLLRPGGTPPQPRRRIIDIFRPREEPPAVVVPAEPAKPEPPKAKPTAAIMRDARGQYIVRGREKCYWSESRKAWREPIKGGCAGGICGYRDIKPGE